MPYATTQQLIDRLGLREATALSDRAGAGSVDQTVLGRALDDASAEMDGYLGRRYALPLTNRSGTPLASVPASLTVACIDIARYRLTGTEVMETETIRNRFKDALKLLQDLAEGRAQVGGADLALANAGGNAPAGGAFASRTQPKTFGDMGGVL